MTQLINWTAHDGSRQFLVLPESVPGMMMRDHVASLPAVKSIDYLADGGREIWIDFVFRGHRFTVNNQCGEYWFFVSDPVCPNDVVLAVATHFARITGP